MNRFHNCRVLVSVASCHLFVCLSCLPLVRHSEDCRSLSSTGLWDVNVFSCDAALLRTNVVRFG